jgi:hypothetical protein
VKLYHRTTAAFANSILEGGFLDYSSTFMTSEVHTGVWLSNIPADEGDGILPSMTSLLLIETTLSENELAKYEWIDGPSGNYREWLIPAALVNANSKVTKIDVDEYEDQMENEGKP